MSSHSHDKPATSSDGSDDNEQTKRSLLDTYNPGYIVGGAGVAWKATSQANAAFFNNVKENNRFPYLEEAREEAFSKAYPREAEQGKEKLREKLNEAWQKEKEKPGSIQKAIDGHVGQELEKDGIKHWWNKWMRLKFHQKREVVITYATLLSFVAGAVYSHARQNKLAHKLHNQEKKTEEEKIAPITVPTTEGGSVDIQLKDAKEILQKILDAENFKQGLDNAPITVPTKDGPVNVSLADTKRILQKIFADEGLGTKEMASDGTITQGETQELLNKISRGDSLKRPSLTAKAPAATHGERALESAGTGQAIGS